MPLPPLWYGTPPLSLPPLSVDVSVVQGGVDQRGGTDKVDMQCGAGKPWWSWLSFSQCQWRGFNKDRCISEKFSGGGHGSSESGVDLAVVMVATAAQGRPRWTKRLRWDFLKP
jgi:hypothetical protein